MKSIFYGGTILTMDDSNPIVESVLVENGKIQSLGIYDEIVKQKDEDTQMIDLKGSTMMPGFFEPHVHPEVAALQNQAYYNGGLKYDTVEEVINVIKEAIKETPKGKWIMVFGLDNLINRDLPEIDRYYLDELTSEHPLYLQIQSMHTVIANSMALEKANIKRDTPDSRDGHIYRDENGEPTGILTEQALAKPFFDGWMGEKGINFPALVPKEYDNYKKVGITSCWTAGAVEFYPGFFNSMHQYTSSEKSPIRNDYAVPFHAIEAGIIDVEKLPEDTEKMKFTGVKFWYDGSPYTGNMFLEENYINSEIMQDKLHVPKDQAGERLFPQEVFYELLKKYHNLGYQISIHGQGDRAVRELIEMFDKLLTEYPRDDHRHRLEHCALMSVEDIKKCGELGITLSYHNGHIYYYGEALSELVLGEERANKLMACRTAIDNGVTISFHSDNPMYEASPLRVACTAITRTTKKGTVIGMDEAITVHEAMKGITINAAWQQKRENELGSIEVGKYADFTILKENPYVVDPLHIGDIKVITTYLSGVNTDEI